MSKWSTTADRFSHTQADALNLLEDGLQLWLVLLRNAPAPRDELAVVNRLAEVLEGSTEHTAVGAQVGWW